MVSSESLGCTSSKPSDRFTSPEGAWARFLPLSPGACLVPNAVAEVLNYSTSAEAPKTQQSVLDDLQQGRFGPYRLCILVGAGRQGESVPCCLFVESARRGVEIDDLNFGKW